MRKIRILVADDHAIVRMGLVALLNMESDFTVVGEAEDGAEAVGLVAGLKPDVVVMDLMMPLKDGVVATREIRAADPSVQVVVLTTSNSGAELARAKEAGATGLVVKTASNDELLTAIRMAAAGKTYVSSEAALAIEGRSGVGKLTGRQRDVLVALTQGLTNRDIAKTLGVSDNCVKIHLSGVFAKLGASNRGEAIAIALRERLV